MGNGRSVDILGDPWLSDEVNPYVTTNSEASKGNKVASLLDMNQNQ